MNNTITASKRCFAKDDQPACSTKKSRTANNAAEKVAQDIRDFNDFIEETNMVDKPITIWRNKIKNCKFDCWDCGYCDKIMAAKYGNHINPKVAMVAKELVDSVNNPIEININIKIITVNFKLVIKGLTEL